MRPLALALLVGLAGSAGHAQDKAGVGKDLAAAEKAFRAWGDRLVGGVWSGTSPAGNKVEERWEWILEKSFLKLTWKSGKDAGISLAGIDPATGKLACWEFDDKGRVWRGTVEIEKPGVWVWSSTGQGRSGRPSSWKGRATLVSEDEIREELLESVEDGKKQPTGKAVLRRKK
jgi:hypothetical protein